MKFLVILFLLLSSVASYAEDDAGDTSLIYDSSGNPLHSTSNALNSFVTNFPATQAVTQSTSPWVVSGTITSNQGTSPWVTNISQFGGSNVVTGTGASGAGIPRVTVSNDSNILATQSGTWTTGRTWTLSSGTDSVSAVQSGTWTVQQGTPPWSASQSGAWTVTSNQGTSPWTIQGDSASGASKAGNPVQIGGVFNTTQPTVTTGQTVEAQSTARGAQIVATGVDAFNVNATQTTSPWVVSGTVTANQGTSPWVSNVSQFGGNNVVTGTGASGVGIPRVTVSNDSNILATQSGTWTVQPGNTANTTPWLVTVATALPAGSNTIGAVTQASGPWTSNVTQFGGTNISTGTGAGGSGIPRVTVSNDSNILATQSGTWTVQQGTPPWSVVGNVASGSADSGNPVKAGSVFNSTLPTPSSGNRVDLQGDLNGRLLVAAAPLDGYKQTYAASINGLTLAASPTDILTLQGSATKTIRILRIELTVSTTSGSPILFDPSLLRRTAANTGGTTVTDAATAFDSNNAAATAVAKHYTANATALGASSGTGFRAVRTSATNGSILGGADGLGGALWTFGDLPGQSIVLRGTSDFLALNLGATAITGAIASFSVEWTEE